MSAAFDLATTAITLYGQNNKHVIDLGNILFGGGTTGQAIGEWMTFSLRERTYDQAKQPQDI